MFVTPLNFNQVLERFYHQDKYELLLLFVSSFDGNDITIIREIINNAKRIDRITGNRICFFYFVKETYDCMNEKLVRWVKDLPDWESLYGEGVSVTMETADDICGHFGVLRSNLPAFILINKYRQEKPQILSIHEYHDFESFLTPLNILHSYIEDREYVLSHYEQERRKNIVTKEDVFIRNQQRRSWIIAVQQLERKKAKELSLGLIECANERDVKISEFKNKLESTPILVEKGIDESIPYPQEELQNITNNVIEKLNIALNTHDGNHIIEELQNPFRYSEAVLQVWHLVRDRGVRISGILEKIRFEIQERRFDVFISCKSQDYALTHELYDHLANNGFTPFLADSSIKEVGIDQYTALIGEVINVCQNMIVFATDVTYLETPYVAAEWHTFINDINTGHKPYAKIVSILSPDINPHDLPTWLRDKQSFTTENYHNEIIHFLKNRDEEATIKWEQELSDLFCCIWGDLNRLQNQYSWDYEVINKYVDYFKTQENRLKHGLDEIAKSYDYYEKESAINRFKEELLYTKKRWASIKSIMKQTLDEKRERNGQLNHIKGPQGIAKKESKSSSSISFSPLCKTYHKIISNFYSSIWDSQFYRKTYNVYSSIFSSSEVMRNSHMLIQVFLHLLEETDKVKTFAQESDKNAERRDYIPLQCKLKKGDKVEVLLNIYGETLLMSDKKSVVWQGSFTKCSFDYFIPKDIDVEELSCAAILSVNGVPVGEMRFITSIVDSPRLLNPEIIAHKYSKVFISYSHRDESKVKFLHEGLKLGSVPHFFDRSYLKPGDVFPQKIQDYINSADLFILCWSENASNSDYVRKERLQALERAFPQVRPEQAATLRIYPMSIEPHAELPGDMKNYYHFGEI